MHDRSQYNLARAGLAMTLVGLAALFLVPIAVGIRLQREYGRIDQLERSRLAINDAMEVARKSDTFLMHRYMVPGAAQGQYVADTEYRNLTVVWRAAISKTEVLEPLSPSAKESWHTGAEKITRWINTYLVRYTGNRDPGGAATFEQEEKSFRSGLAALASARTSAARQEEMLRRRLEWLNTAQITVVTPMAIVCFALAFLAWTNVRTLQLTWAREREVSGELEVAVKESNHRIKNNLQVIGALIDMKIQEPGDLVPKSALEEIVHQVRAVAAVHDFFSHELRSDQVRGDQLLRRLVDLTALPIGLSVQLESEEVALVVKQATAVALITNELLLNSGKHGATEARIVMKVTGPVARLRVSDNGPGFPPNFDAANDANLGLALVDTLARHDLQGHILFANDGGARVEVTFPIMPAA